MIEATCCSNVVAESGRTETVAFGLYTFCVLCTKTCRIEDPVERDNKRSAPAKGDE
jgi:hypothetical protein